jgi:sec-independent protein translocase protein TatB
MFGTLGGPELFLILVVALIVFGPRKLPEIGKSLGRMMGEFRRASNEFRRTIEDEVEAEKLREATKIEVPSLLSPPAETPPVHGPATASLAEAPPTSSTESASTSSSETPAASSSEASPTRTGETSPTPLAEARAGTEPPSDTVSRGELPAQPK